MNRYDDIFALAALFKTFFKGISNDWNKHGFGLTLPQFKVMYLIEREGPRKVSEIAHSLGITPSGVIWITDQLEKEGYVRKERAETDRRVVHVILTDPGGQQLHQAQALQKQLMQSYFHLLTDEDIGHLQRIFTTLNQSLDQT
ncbi:MarR family winged helix-turn-helix transcriptional regulator [Paenibacillus koleovorans]|uniref:MarR family winged helix-turn-helix transcriptional regulator n=1 Tax=Paenibacillus koleovorans TaxID=121608 RepID=UPI000FDB3BE7|nr:MarR family transcriptional regulator [Paenibacillus koleovorans]